MTPAMRRALLALAAAAVVPLAACADGDERTGTVSADPPPPVPNTAPASRPAEPAPPASAPAVAALPPPATPTPGPQGPPADFRRLVGVKGETLREWMGEVVFVRRDGQAEIWRFAADTCFLDVFLYREPDGLRVAHLDARSRSTGRVTLQACYGRILASRNRKAS